MNCNELKELVKDFLQRIPLYAPFRNGQVIILKVNECSFEVVKKGNKFEINRTSNCENKLIIRLKDVESFKFLFQSQNLEDYGNQLVNLAIQEKITMDLGPFENPMKSGFHRFIGYRKKVKGLETYQCVIPLF